MTNIALLMGAFHRTQIEEMVDEARTVAKETGLTIVTERWVPGSYEKPIALKQLFSRNDIDAVVILGIIERGETKHGLVMAQSVSDAFLRLELEFMKPIGMGILGPEILPSQIPARLRPYARAAVRAIHVMLTEK